MLKATNHDDGHPLYGRRPHSPLVPFKKYSVEKLIDELLNEGENINDFECIGDVPNNIQNKIQKQSIVTTTTNSS